MTVEEFKKEYPHQAHLEGNELWTAMENALIRQQVGSDIIQTIQPFFRRYKLRYLFYRSPRGPFAQAWDSPTLCKNCGHGTNNFMMLGRRKYCLGCSHVLVIIPNKKITYILRKAWQFISKIFWKIMQFLHVVKTDISSRYDVFGDEYRYVYHLIDTTTFKQSLHHLSRKWWEYIFIKR